MHSPPAQNLGPESPPFRHEAFLYASEAEFAAGALDFIRGGIEADEPILVAVSAEKIALLSEQLGPDRDALRFADMAQIGSNPARIIPAWRQFLAESSAAGGGIRGIGEPVWPGRSAAELIECQRHESLLNLAFADTDGFTLLCPYDTSALDDDVLEEARRSHPVVVADGAPQPSSCCRPLDAVAAPFDVPLPEPSGIARELAFSDASALGSIRGLTARVAGEAGLSHAKRADLVLAVNEVATNTLRHAGGAGLLRLWRQPDGVLCEVRDRGRIPHPLAGREAPVAGQRGGWGLWMANQLCDLVQIRSFEDSSVVRLHMRVA